MSSAETLRAKQNMEVLDVWKNLYSQVNALTKRQISVFPDTLKPKTQRDLETEVNVDKSVETINRTLEGKLTSLEAVIQFLEFQNVGLQGQPIKQANVIPFQNAFTNAVNTGDVIPLWNSIVRFYTKQGLSKQSQEMVKVKVQELEANLEAILFGFQQTVEKVFEKRSFSTAIGLKMLDFLRTQSVYQLIKDQVDNSSFELISVPLLDTAFKNIFAELTQEQRELLQSIADRGELGETPIRKIPTIATGDFDERIRQVASELGVSVARLPVDRLRTLTQRDFQKWVDQAIQEVKGRKVVWEENERKAVERLAQKQDELDQIERRLADIPRLEGILRDQIRQIEDDEFKVDESDLMEVPEAPVAPADPDVEDYVDSEGHWAEGGYEEAYARYEREYDIYKKAFDKRREVMEWNDFVREMAEERDREGREELIKDKERELEELEQLFQQLQEQRDSVEEEVNELIRNTDRSPFSGRNVRRTGNALAELARIRQKYRHKQTMGRGKPHKGADIDTRGLASMRHHYGAMDKSSDKDDSETDSESSDEEDALDFDDRRNDMYYSRPKK